MTIYLYSTREEPYGAFSNFSAHGFALDSKRWPTSEHYFQAQKFVGTPHEEEIRRARTPREAANRGRERTRPLHRDWEAVKDDVMRRAVRHKFTAHADLRSLLLDTGAQEIVESAPSDYYWGCGADGSERNLLGIILMETRAQLRAEVTLGGAMTQQLADNDHRNDALIIVDVQNDFCPGGALAVGDGDAVVPIINVLAPRFGTVVATQDWHPADHRSFLAQGGPWPVHCIAGTSGAAFHPALDTAPIDLTVRKAMVAAEEAYSGFDGTDLAQQLRERGVRRVYVAGLALDYCVDATALDGRKAGFDTYVIEDATRAVFPEHTATKEAEWRNAGVQIVTSDEI